MPRVPSYDNFQTTPSAQPLPQIQGGGLRPAGGPNAGSIGADQVAKFGDAATRLGDAVGVIAQDLTQQVNETRVIDAVNKAKERMFDLTYNKDSGYSMQKGIDALQRPEGGDLAVEYTQKFQKDVDAIGATLSNDFQKQAFNKQARQMRTEMYGGAERHISQEFTRYQSSVYDGATINAQRQIALNYTDVAKGGAVEQGVASIDAATRAKARLAGLSQEFADTQVRKAVSNAHVLAIATALEKNDVTFADGYLKKFAGQMDADDILKTQGHVTKGMELKLSQGAVQLQTAKAMPVLAPTSFDNLKAVRTQLESGNLGDFKADGTPVQSKLSSGLPGAKYKNQVMDATAANPGFGIKPADTKGTKEQVAAEYNRVGDELLDALVVKYGDPRKALAAYNAGSGAVDKALVKAANGKGAANGSDGWLAYMPAETQGYVAKGTQLLAKGGPVAPRPTELDFVNGAVQNLPAGSSPGAIKTTRDAAIQQFGIITKTLNEKGENALAAGQRWLAESGATTLTQLPPAIRDDLMRYAPGKLDDLERFAKSRGDVPTDWGTYTDLRALAVSQPAKFAATDLRQSYHLLAPAQREQLLDLQTKAKEPGGKAEIATLGQQLTTAHQLLGLKGSDAEKKGKFDDAVTQVLAADKKEKGRPLTFEERDKVIKRMMLPTSGESWYSSSRKVYEVSGTADEANRPPKINDDDRKLITAALTSERMPVTEENIQARFKLRYGIK